MRKLPGQIQMEKNSKIFVAGGRGMVGGAIIRALRENGYGNIAAPRRDELDLCDQRQTRDFFEAQKPEYVFVAAAKVGGIAANSHYPADFLYENLLLEANIIHSAWLNKCKKLLFLGSSCIYPKFSPQPITEDALLSGYLESTNEGYALAKIAGVKLAEFYSRQYGFNTISAMPTNLYGPGDNFHPENSHVLPALMRRFHEAKISGQECVTVWGTGTPLREFMHVDDLADACLFLMNKYSGPTHINVGTGEETSIRDLAKLVAKITGYKGRIDFDKSRPDGTPRKVMDSRKLYAMGWKPKIALDEGLADTYAWYLSQESVRGGRA